MKAQFVYENMKFERGVDPKKAMGIGMRERIKKMMKKNDWEYKDDNDALTWTANYDHKDIVEFLLKVGADVHLYNDYYLRKASQNGHKDIVELLLKAGADVHAQDDDALLWASYRGHIDVVKILLKAGADVHAKNDTALQWALKKDHVEIVELLRKYM